MFKAIILRKVIYKPVIKQMRHHSKLCNFLKSLPQPEYTVLKNGVTVASEYRENCPVGCVGIFADAGSRYENCEEVGLTHLIEHVVFKGTKNCSSSDIEAAAGSRGARLRCKVGKELFAVYAECMGSDMESMVKILADCLFNNAVSVQEMEAQKQIVTTELASNETNYSQIVYDHLHGTAFQGTPLANYKLGQCHTILRFSVQMVQSYIQTWLKPKRVVLAAVGPIQHKVLVSAALTSQLCNIGSPCDQVCENKRVRFTGADMRCRDDSMPYAHVAVAFEGPHFEMDEKLIMDVAAMYIGAWDRYQGGAKNDVRVCAGAGYIEHFCEAYRMFNYSYKDIGLWGIYFMGSTIHLDSMINYAQHEFLKLCSRVTENQLSRAKCQLKTKILTDHMDVTHSCTEIARWSLFKGCIPSILDRVQNVDKIDVPCFRSACDYYLYDKLVAVAAVGPTEGLTDYNRLTATTYSLLI